MKAHLHVPVVMAAGFLSFSPPLRGTHVYSAGVFYFDTFSFILEASRVYWTVSNVILAYHHACFPFMACSRGSAINRDAVIPRLSFKKQLLKWRYGLKYTRLTLGAAD